MDFFSFPLTIIFFSSHLKDMENNDNGSKNNMKKSLESAARAYKAAKEMEQSALKMKRLADDLFIQVEKSMEEFKSLGKDFLEYYNDFQTSANKPLPEEPSPTPPQKDEGIVIKRKNIPAE